MGISPAQPLLPLADAVAQLTQPDGLFAMEKAVVRGQPYRVWKNGPQILQDILARCDAFSSREAFVCGDVRIRYGGFNRAVSRLARDMAARGVGPGVPVALLMRNRPEWALAFFAVVRAGGIIVPMNAWWTASELTHALGDSKALFVVCDAEHFPQLSADRCDRGSIWVCGDGAAPGGIRLEEITGPAQQWDSLPEDTGEWPGATPDDLAAIFYTSGTEGHPRGVLCSHRNLLVSTIGMQYALALDALRSKGVKLPEDFLEHPQQCVLLSVPLFHVIGACAVLLPSLYCGARIVLMYKWDTPEAFRLIAREHVHQLWGVPTVARMLLDHPARGQYDLSSLQLITYGGALYRPDLVGLLRTAFPGVNVGCGWGMTETSAIATGLSGLDFVRHSGCSGLALPVCDIRVRDLTGQQDLPPDTVGELWVRGPNIAAGYRGHPSETDGTFVDGWLRTGDLARIDAEGFCTIVGRIKDMVIRGGENIYCADVETVLCRHPDVSEAALVPVADPVLGEVPGAIVVLRPACTPDEASLRAFAARDLAAYKVPVRIIFSQTPLPRNAAGKLVRGKLRSFFTTETQG